MTDPGKGLVVPASPREERLVLQEPRGGQGSPGDEVLSDLETEVLRLYVEGKSYQKIAERLQRRAKSIDNVLQRIKRTLKGHLRDRAVADLG